MSPDVATDTFRFTMFNTCTPTRFPSFNTHPQVMFPVQPGRCTQREHTHTGCQQAHTHHPAVVKFASTCCSPRNLCIFMRSRRESQHVQVVLVSRWAAFSVFVCARKPDTTWIVALIPLIVAFCRFKWIHEPAVYTVQTVGRRCRGAVFATSACFQPGRMAC